jgi:hypothetical protein
LNGASEQQDIACLAAGSSEAMATVPASLADSSRPPVEKQQCLAEPGIMGIKEILLSAEPLEKKAVGLVKFLACMQDRIGLTPTLNVSEDTRWCNAVQHDMAVLRRNSEMMAKGRRLQEWVDGPRRRSEKNEFPWNRSSSSTSTRQPGSPGLPWALPVPPGHPWAPQQASQPASQPSTKPASQPDSQQASLRASK